ncbi:nitrilase-related carbon-nitrogen hydrolase [Planctomycetota bacterium]
MNLDDIIDKYTDNRDSLSEEEFDFLLDAMEKDPDLLSRLKDQLVLDELLSREIGEDRLCFLEQVEQRLRAEKDATGFQRKVERKKEEGAALRSGTAAKRKKNGSDRMRKRRSHSRHTRRSWPGIVWMSAAACLVIAVGAYFYNMYQAAQIPKVLKAELINSYGRVTIEHNGKEVRAADRVKIYSGDTIKTGKGGEAEIQYSGEGTVLSITSESELKVNGANGANRVLLEKGNIECEIAPQLPGRSFSVITEHSEIIVKGTYFTVSLQPDSTRLEVIEGLVGFTRKSDGQSIDVKPGYYAVAGKKYKFIAQKITDTPFKQKIKAALVQVDLRKNTNPDENMKRTSTLIRQAASQGAELIILPALSFDRTYNELLTIAQPLDGQQVTAMKNLAKELNIHIAFGFREKIDVKKTGNTAVLIDSNGEIILTQRKIELASAEINLTQAGKKTNTVKTRFGTIVMMISKDIHSGTALHNAKKLDFDIMLVLNSDENVNRYFSRLRKTAHSKKCTILMANIIDPEGGGRSAAFFQNGKIDKMIPETEEGIHIIEIPVK